uniref:26S protease regulatory subunit S10B n=1 Tax=Arundo donax TaxID=35708 RepID=A0A0A9E118_ARUDO
MHVSISLALSSWMKSMPLVDEDLARVQVQIVRFKGH